jgi:UDP-glucose 4-epimerase
MTMKYLLLGGAGFIGKHLAQRLSLDAHEVTIIDSCTTSSPPSKLNNIKLFVQDNIQNIDLDLYVKNADVVYYLAGSVGVQNVMDHPHQTLMNNVQLMQHLGPVFNKHKKKVVFSSTSEVYGEGPFVEHSALNIGNPKELRWSYASAKLTTEFMITTGDFPYVIVRFFNVVGPGQLPDYGMVLPRFVQAAKQGQDLVVYGGKQIRSFCHVHDAVEQLLLVEQANNEIFNIGNNEPVTISELAERVITLSGSSSRIRYVDIPFEDINHRVPDLSKNQRFTGYVNQYGLDNIIQDLL